MKLQELRDVFVLSRRRSSLEGEDVVQGVPWI